MLPVTVKIDGEWYDLTDFAKHHPGGSMVIHCAAQRDATALFISHHPFASERKMNALLDKYRMSREKARGLVTSDEILWQKNDAANATMTPANLAEPFSWEETRHSAFRKELYDAVRAYFKPIAKERGISLRAAAKATPARWLQLACLSLLWCMVLARFVRGDLWTLLGLPTITWILGVNVFHDGTHSALSEKPWINALGAYLFPYFSSPLVWYHEHIIGHHTYPNIPFRDPDLLHGTQVHRDHPIFPWHAIYAAQAKPWRILFRFMVAMPVGLALDSDVELFVTGSYNHSVPLMANLTRRRILAHFLGRVGTYVMVYGVPLWWFSDKSLPVRLLFSVIPASVMSVMFMVNTQVNHLTPGTVTAHSSDWYKHQVLTAQNFGIDNTWCFWFSGGLNHQIEHHLFPTVNHCHWPHLQPIVRDICKKHDVPYKCHAGYIAALREYVRHTSLLGLRPLVKAKE